MNQKNQKITPIILAFLVLGLLFFTTHLTYSQSSGYKPETDSTVVKDVSTPQKLINNIYEFLIPLSGVLGLVAFAIGGFQYMISAGNNALLSSAKERMLSAIVGIVIVLTAYIFLKIINPEIIKMEIPNPSTIAPASSKK